MKKKINWNYRLYQYIVKEVGFILERLVGKIYFESDLYLQYHFCGKGNFNCFEEQPHLKFVLTLNVFKYKWFNNLCEKQIAEKIYQVEVVIVTL